MSKRYNYKYKTSRRKNNGGLITLVIILAVIVIAIILFIVNLDTIKSKLYDLLGLQNETTATTETSGSESSSENTTTDVTGSASGSQESSESTATNLKWYEKELVFSDTPINIEPLVNELRDYIYQFTGEYGISFLDLTTGATFGLNDIDYYAAASTIKIPLMLYIYDKVANEELNMNTKITYLEEDTEGGTGYIINHGTVGEEYPLRLLCKYAIIYSDNIATNMLMRTFGKDNIKAFMRLLGGEIVSDTENDSCPRDMALYLSKLVLFEQEYPDLGREIISYLEKTHMTEGGYVNTPGADTRLIKYLPAEIKVAHKIGNVTGGWHDVGIIYADKPYILAVMTYGVLYDEVEDVIANISKKVYEYLLNLETY
jgi:beta-lactamase class A